MKDPLKSFTIAITGDFGESRGHDKMKQWIIRNGGKFTMDISPKVTHLICSKEHYKKAVIMVKQAHFLKTVHIVSFDWLEDSLMKGRPRNERDYLMGPRVKAEAATKAKKKKVRKENIKQGMEAFEKSVKDFEKDMNSSGYGIYHDPFDNFPYDITLVRPSLLDNKNERYRLKVCSTTPSPHPPPKPLYIPPHRRILTSHHPNTSDTSCSNPTPNPNPILSTPLLPITPPHPRACASLVNPHAQRLQLYVSHSVPKYYSCYVIYTAPNTTAVSQMLAPIGSGWETAWGVFEGFFRLKTGREWGERLGGVWKIGTGVGYVQGSGAAGRGRGNGERLFEYNVPSRGQPRGMVGAVDHEAVLEREVERLRGLWFGIGKGWDSREGQSERNGGVEIEAGEEWSTRRGKGVSQQEWMGVGEYETRIALDGGQRQEVGTGQETGQRASPGQNVMGFRINKEHNEMQMKAKTEHVKMVQGEQDAKVRWDMVKRLEVDNGVGGDGKDDFIKLKRDYAKMKEGELDAQARWERVKLLEADKGAGFGGYGKTGFMKLEKYGRNVDSGKMKMDYGKILKEQTDAQARWEKIKHM